MYEVQISAGTYEQARRAAEAQHVTLDAFIEEAVQLHLQADEDVVEAPIFTPERIAEIREAQAEARTGNNITLDQYRAEATRRRAEWQANHPA